MKYIMFDLDDTLLNHRREVPDFTMSVLKRLQEMGHKLVINTARSKSYAWEYFEKIQPDYAIFNGGAFIIDKEARAVFRAEMSPETTGQVVETLLKLTRNFTVQTEDKLYSHLGLYTGQGALFYDFEGEPLGLPAQKIVANLEDEAQALAIAKEFDLEYTCYFGGNFRRFNHREATKARGARNLLKLVNGRREDLLAFGDDLGDLDMIREAGVGVLMKNARPNLHGQAGILSEYTNEEEGVARFLVDYFSL